MFFFRVLCCCSFIGYFSASLWAQISPPHTPETIVREMTYDRNNRLYYDLSNDNQYLYISIYKNENSKKIVMPGGVQYYFAVDGQRDTAQLSRLTFPAYSDKTSQMGKTLIHVARFTDQHDRYMSVPNTLDINTAVEHKRLVENSPYSSKLSVPLKLIKPVNGTIDICIVLRGIRTKPIDAGTVPPVVVSKPPFKGISKDKMEEMADLDTWTETWIHYVLK